MLKGFFLYLFFIFSTCSFSQNNEISSYEKTIKIQGVVFDGNYSIGNATISFINSENIVFNTKSDFAGNFNITLPKNRYRILGEKYGYEMVKDQNTFYDFTRKKDNYSLDILLKQIPSIIEGRVLDEDGNPIKNAKITIKSKENLDVIKSDNFGMFRLEVPMGLISIFAEKNGYFGNGTAILLESESLRNNIAINLQRKFFSISGVLTNSVESLGNKTIYLIDSNNKKILGKTVTSPIGYYEFLNIPGQSKVKIVVDIKEYKKFSSDEIIVNSNINKFNIFLD
ncbi:MAG: hypothetical protein ACRC0W_06485 [Cetobacterium sp.]